MIAIAACACLITAIGLTLFLQRRNGDFWIFYAAGTAWRLGANPYTAHHPTMNPPSIVAGVFAPMSRLPYSLAQIGWILGGVAGLAASVRAISRTLHFSTRQTIWMVSCLGVTYASWLTWFQGQIAWLLLYPVTRGWIALRSGRHVSAGAWLGVLIAIKPQFAVLTLMFRPQVWMTAAASSLLLTLIGIACTGWAVWQAWLDQGAHVTHFSWPDNASLWGVAAREQSGDLFTLTTAGFPWIVVILIALLTLGAAAKMLRVRNPDRRFTAAMVWALLLCPLGWIYYLPLAVGPAAASWRDTRLNRVVLGLLTVPLPLIGPILLSPLAVRLLGNLYAYALLLMWWEASRSDHGGSERATPPGDIEIAGASSARAAGSGLQHSRLRPDDKLGD